MRPERIDQVVPSFASRDAIGVHMLHLRGLLRDMGFASEIWCRGAFDDVRSQCRILDELGAGPRRATWWLYHMSNGSPAAELIGARSEPLMVDYHNITPGELFHPWVGWAAESADEARAQLADLAARAQFSFADSAFNEAELLDLGFGSTRVAPPMFDPSAHEVDPDPGVLAELRTGSSGNGAQWLFVGRVAPPKAQHDLIKAFACYTRWFDSRARLHLVGTWMGERYPRALMRFADRLGLGTSVRLAGAVSDRQLSAYYQACDVYVSASDHEGFCVPVVEAMHFGMPVVAYAAGAIPETAGDAALLVDEKSPLEIACAVGRVASDPALRARLCAEGRARSELFSLTRSRARWASVIDEAVAADGGGVSRLGPHAAADA